MSNLNKVIRFLKSEFKEINHTIPSLNYGGCGVFAYYTSLTLSRIGVKHSIVALDWEFENKKEFITRNRNNKQADPMEEILAFHHVVIHIEEKDIYIDSEAVYHKDAETGRLKGEYDDAPIAGKLTRPELKYALKGYGWNRQFYRPKYEPIIKKKFQSIERRIKPLIQTP